VMRGVIPAAGLADGSRVRIPCIDGVTTMLKRNALLAMIRNGIPVLLTPALVMGASTVAADMTGREIMENRCIACHAVNDADQTFSRISEQRKSPEGWHMTLNRMQHHRDVVLPADEKRTLIKYLADTQGLAPDESAPYRYLLEQDTNRVEDPHPALAENCARCHSSARIGLQRRSVDEWESLVHFHIGQIPTLELQAGSRDREWFHLARTEVLEVLADEYPLESAAWDEWQQTTSPELAGSWWLFGSVPGKGDFEARMQVEETDADHFQVQLDGHYADGQSLQGNGTATRYTGYEWRASLDLDGRQVRQVMAASRDGADMHGRQFERDAREMGGELRAVRDSGESAVVAVMPGHLRTGETATLTLVGSELSGDIGLGDGIRVLEEVARSADRITVRVQAEGEPGRRDVRVGDARGTELLTVYDTISRLEVQPENAVARIGGPGDSQMEKVRVPYRAIAYATGPNGEELRLGTVPVSWSVEPSDEYAEAARDHVYAGEIDEHGIFTPADAGPNPERFMSGNNTGRLAVIATLDQNDAQQAVQGRGSLIVSVPDFVRKVLY
jgi:quinohemoprotein amine dehydrogenase